MCNTFKQIVNCHVNYDAMPGKLQAALTSHKFGEIVQDHWTSACTQALNVRHCQAPSRVSFRRILSQVMHSAAADDSSRLLHRQSVSWSLEHNDNFLFLNIIPLSTHLQQQ